MNWVFFQSKESHYLSPSHPPFFLSHPPPPPPSLSTGFNVENKISPTVLLIIIILAIIFFISGLLHLLVRFLLRPQNREPEDLDNVTALQGQLQQLFHLHDSGVDQSFIDAHPIFHYKAIIGLKNPFDCAICLCEFEAEDKLRLLPKCSHAFHMDCIDTWLLSHSTCPLCRGSLIPDFSPNNNFSPIVLVLESGSESSREIISEREIVQGNNSNSNSVSEPGVLMGIHGEDDLGFSCNDYFRKSSEISVKEREIQEKVVTVKLGKFRNVDEVNGEEGGEGSSSNSTVDARRCFSMGSFEYVMDESSSLQVAIKAPSKKQTSKKPSLPLTSGHRPARSECDCHSSREGFKGFGSIKSTEIQTGSSIFSGNDPGRKKRESFSVSKTWLRSKEKPCLKEDSSRRAFSFRFPIGRMSIDDLKQKNTCNSRRTISEIDIEMWENGRSEMGFDEEIGGINNTDLRSNPSSFARTLLWVVGRENKVVHSSSSPNS